MQKSLFENQNIIEAQNPESCLASVSGSIFAVLKAVEGLCLLNYLCEKLKK